MKQEPKPEMRTRPLRDDELKEAMEKAREAKMDESKVVLKIYLPEWWEGHELRFDGTHWQFIDTVSDVPLVFEQKKRSDAESLYQKIMDDPFRGPALFQRMRAMAQEESVEYAVAV